MPMGVLSDDLFENEINSFVRPNVEIVEKVNGRNGSHAVPESLRKIIAEESINGSPAKELEKVFDVSASSISAYKNGATSTTTYHEPNKSLESFTNKIKDVIAGKARSKLINALDSITPEKLKEVRVDIAANVARNMSAIVKDMEPSVERTDEGNKPQFVVIAPQFRDEKTFEVVKVKE